MSEVIIFHCRQCRASLPPFTEHGSCKCEYCGSINYLKKPQSLTEKTSSRRKPFSLLITNRSSEKRRIVLFGPRAIELYHSQSEVKVKPGNGYKDYREIEKEISSDGFITSLMRFRNIQQNTIKIDSFDDNGNIHTSHLVPESFSPYQYSEVVDVFYSVNLRTTEITLEIPPRGIILSATFFPSDKLMLNLKSGLHGL